MKEWRFPDLIDRSTWPSGAWDDEPDKAEWRDEATGLPCIARRGPLGQWCGYVAVPPGHPWHGKDYDAVDCRAGVNYAAPCEPEADEASVCHVPAEGEPDDVWWLGFDFGHCFDVIPYLAGAGHRVFTEDREGWPKTTYKTLEYTRAECASLAHEAAAVAGTGATA